MTDRQSAFLVDFLATYNRVAKIGNWQVLSQHTEFDMLGCPFCPWDPVVHDHRRDVRGAEWADVWSVTQEVFAKHKVKKPSFGSCWSVHDMLERIQFEE